MTMAATNQDLRSFQHCRKDIDLVCFRLPTQCPLCGQSTATTESRIPPYVLPSPFVSSHTTPRTIVLKPTEGDFIRNYERTCDLHIGVTDSKGLVYDFDERGLNQGSVWPHCLVVWTHDQPAEWDQALSYICGQPAWSARRYDEHGQNCFTFVLHFLSLLPTSQRAGVGHMTKEEFCDSFLVSRTKKAEQYIHLYRQALEAGCVVVPKSMHR
ncbi:MKRN2 opposite strand protein [Aplysia californica]|uniref:MKRN2 opposite strand protein n=1 Tax=Aplysia californica TaxID=6500 RepID=A0ABM0K5C4_APLCA|nr:MKRN2 opposite strand protein [Aplysia californica]